MSQVPLEDEQHGLRRRKGFDPLFIGAVVLTAVLHAGGTAYVVHASGAKTEDKVPEINVMATKLVRLGKPRDKRLLPQRDPVPPPPPTEPIKGPALTEDVQAPAAKPEKKKEKVEKPDDDKLLKKLQDKLRKQKTDEPPNQAEPEGLATGSASGTAATAEQGDPCGTAIFNVVHENWKVPELINERQLRGLNARMRVRLNKDGSLTDAKITASSRNNYFDNSLLEVIERVGKTPETKSVISKECTKFGPLNLRFVGSALK